MDANQVQLLQWGDLAALAPELTLVIAAIVISLIDLFLPRRVNRNVIGWLSLGSVLASLGFVLWQIVQRAKLPLEASQAVQLLNHSYRIDDFALLIKIVLLVGTGFVLLLSLGSLRDDEEEIPHRGEYYYFLLPAAVGGMIMASSGDLITLYVGLELLSITSYILVGMKKNDRKATEGAFKYVVLGSVASAFVLYGMSFVYGMTGTTNLGGIAAGLRDYGASFEALVYVSFILMFVGFGFKIAAAPFHAWAPDVYQGAATPVTAFLAVVSKAAGFAILFRIFYNLYFALGEGFIIFIDLSTLILGVAAASMIIGTTMALRQANAKRLLALSGIANAGYLLVPIGINIIGVNTLHSSSFSEFYYYLFAYMFTNIGAFAVLMVVERSSGHDEMRGYAGLYHRSPWLAAAMTVFVLSLAGIPITAGFFGKLFIILGAVSTHAVWIAIVIMVTSVISFYFYFGFIRQMYMRAGTDEQVRIAVPHGIVIGVCVLAVIALGAFPNLFLTIVNTAFSIPVDLFVR
ncbi:NADH-quinone oxidoreductase subunit N [Paenibacillus sp. 481]|uniref:NADH-quinone oxidoreductase subunit N n=1 Tax=Paenibacillus sp. 481 TaxID=2835869 RepID=UPI001E294A2F|nr:NADH-quinone oxidoreductase subunit N [Paenibacillus sp. 481]UHA75676.1 NADH-quinone oxidoreductase subunit N [Paenibacillus sp. 481]